MATVTIRNLDDDVVEKLKLRAKEHNRSLEAELRQLLSDAAKLRQMRETFLQEAARIREMTAKGRSQSDSVDLLREDRGR